MSRRSEQLKRVTAEFLAEHDAWANDPNRDNPDETYWDAVEELFLAFDEGSMPGELRPLASLVEKFHVEADAFEDRIDTRVEYPHDAFWAAIDRIRKLVNGDNRRAQLPPLETIKELAALPYMQHAQIAAIYGLKDRHGNLLTSLVQKELDTPGSVINTPGSIDGRDWVDPRLKELGIEDEGDDDSQGGGSSNSEAVKRKARRAVEESKPCKESPAELWEQGVTPKQAAAMLRQEEKDVAKQFEQWTNERAFNKKVWEAVDQGVAVPEISKRLKTDPAKVQAAIEARPVVGVGA